MQNSLPKVPGIISDIDGVLVKFQHALPTALEAVRFLKTPLQHIDGEKFLNVQEHLPFCLLTNSGVGTEQHKADEVTKKLSLEGDEKLHGKQVIMNFTPLRPILEGYKDKTILIGGTCDLEALAKDFGLKKYITDEEFCVIYPHMVPYKKPYSQEVIRSEKEKIAERLGFKSVEELNEPFQLHAIFMLHDPVDWGDRIQIICDYLSTTDGKIAKEMPAIGPETHIPIYSASNDLVLRGHFQLPRITFGCFNESLKQVYKAIYKRELKLNLCGKPFELTYKYAEKHLRSLTNLEISNFYMIGDNPKSDIRCANAAGWTSILVKTGVFQQTEVMLNDPEDPAKYVVENVAEAVKLICELEGIPYNKK